MYIYIQKEHFFIEQETFDVTFRGGGRGCTSVPLTSAVSDEVVAQSVTPRAHCTVSQRTQKVWLTDGGAFQGRQSPSSVTVLKFAYVI